MIKLRYFVAPLLATALAARPAWGDVPPAQEEEPQEAKPPEAVGAVPQVPATDPATQPGGKAALKPHRNELIIVPALGGNSDIGVQFGAAVSIAHFRPGYKPYRWRMDAVAAMSVKNDVRGFRAVQQYHGLRFDVPQAIWPWLRADVRLNYLRAIDYEWYGLGNRTGIDNRPPPEQAANANQYLTENIRFRGLFRIQLGLPFELAIATNLRYEFPTIYPGTTLADDAAAGRIIGDKPGFLETLGGGIFIDRRNNEFFPTKGYFYQFGVAQTIGTQQDIRFGEVSAFLMHYTELFTPKVVFATRMIGSLKFGNIPFYELQTGGVYDPLILVGGNRGIRGIPQGRYGGPLKLVNNNELRVSPFPRFNVLAWSVKVGMLGYFDAGRVFADYAYDRARDGRRLGLKYSTGGGFFFQWDEATVFRVEAAYSPDTIGGRGIPSFYFENGMLF